MPTIDERIKQELENENDFLDELFPATAMGVFKGNLRMAAIFVIICGIVIWGLAIWCIVEFVQATDIKDIVRWGFWMTLSSLVGLVIELWVWMQINRIATRAEIQQVEITLRRILEKEG